MSSSEEEVDSETYKNASSLPQWKGILCKRSQEYSSQAPPMEAPAFHIFVHSVFCNKSLNKRS